MALAYHMPARPAHGTPVEPFPGESEAAMFAIHADPETRLHRRIAILTLLMFAAMC